MENNGKGGNLPLFDEEKGGMTLGSLFDGSGGFPLGGMLCGVTPVWSSEIEPFPVRVTTKRMPFMEHLGDVSKLDGAKLTPVDIITFGSPCQDLSIAGKRAGIHDGERSNLFFEAIRIVKEMRCATDGRYPKYIVWENVPGAFSSNKGEDFFSVIKEICSIKGCEVPASRPDKWANAGCVMAEDFSLAWRVFDAQYWGVPQRRKRIYLVADLDGGCAGKILFESEGLSGYSAQGFRAWQAAAGGAADGSGEAGAYCLNDQGGNRMDVTEGVTNTLRAESHHPPLVFENHGQDTRYTGPLDVSQTVLSTFGTGGNNQPFVVTPKTLKIRSGCEGGGKGALIQDDMSATLGTHNDQTVFVPKAFGICAKTSHSMLSDNPKSGFYEAETTRTLDANGGSPVCNQGGMAIVERKPVLYQEVAGTLCAKDGPGAVHSQMVSEGKLIVEEEKTYALQGSMIGRAEKNGPQGDGINEGVSFTLNTADRHAVAYSSSKASFFTDAAEELAGSLVATDYKDPPLVNDEDADGGYIVRRLTPTECARLQGFPDWWCSCLGEEDPTDEDIAWWKEVFETWRLATEPEKKPKTDNQIRKWLKDPHSDSAEYKMWGNGVALPCVAFVIAGIVYYSQFDG